MEQAKEGVLQVTQAEQKQTLKLVTVFILCYKNYTVIHNAVQSVLSQDYPRLELIIADDASDLFDERLLNEKIEKWKKESLERYTILRNRKNVGTVRNLNNALTHMTGDFYITLGADDVLHDNSVISNYVSAFEAQGEDTWWVCGNTIMMTPNMQKTTRVFPEEEDIPYLQRRNPKELFSRWARRSFVTTPAMCFRRGIMDLVGGYDEQYTYMEDWPQILKLLRKGVTPYYIPKHVVKHSTGGISNYNSVNGIAIRKKFLEEKYLMFQTQVDPYIDRLSPDDRKEYEKYMTMWMDRIYIMECIYRMSSYKGKLKMMLKDPRIIGWVFKIKKNRVRHRFLDATREWRSILKLGLVAIIAYAILAKAPINPVVRIGASAVALVTFLMSVGVVVIRQLDALSGITVRMCQKYFGRRA